MQPRLVQNSKRCGSAFLWVFLGLLSSLLASVASAQSPRERAQLELVLVGQLGENSVLQQRITSWFEPDRFHVHVRSAKELDAAQVLAPPGDYALSLWILFDAGRARLYFATAAHESKGSRYLLRELPLEAGLDEIGSEQLAEVAHLSALAVLDGEIQTSRQDVERTLARTPKTDAATAREEAAIELSLSKRQEQSAAPTAGQTERFVLGVGYGASFHSEEGVWHGPRANLGLRFRGAIKIFVSSAFSLPQTHDLGPLSLRIEALSLVTGLRLVRELSPALAIELSAGPGVELVHYTPESAAPGVSAGRSATEARPELDLALGLLLRASRAFRAALVSELALSLSRTRYELLADGGPRTIAEPAQFVPRLGLEARF